MRRPVVSTMTIIRPHRRPVPHHHMVVVSKPMGPRPVTMMASPSQYRPMYVKKPIYRVPAMAMHRPLIMAPPAQPHPAETVMVPQRVPQGNHHVTKTVSVSYSSSKGKGKPPGQLKGDLAENKKHLLPQNKPYKQEQHINNYKMTPPVNTGGFNPGSIVIEGGFKPIIQNVQEVQDRMDELEEESDDTIGTIDLSQNEDAVREVNTSNKATEYFEPMFVPSPPDNVNKHSKKPTGLEYDLLQKKKFYISRKPVRQNMIVIRRRPVSPTFRSQQNEGLDETPMAAERMDTYYLPPSGPVYGMSRNGQVAVPGNTDSGTPTLLTYDGKPVSVNNVVPPPPPGAGSKKKSSLADLVRNTPQFGPFRGDVPPPVPHNIRPENIPQLKLKSNNRPAHAMALQLNPEPNKLPGRTQLSLVRQVEEDQSEEERLVPEASELEEYKYEVDNENRTESDESTEKVIFVLVQDSQELKNSTESEMKENNAEHKESHVHKRDRRSAHNVPGFDDQTDHSHQNHDQHVHQTLMDKNTTMTKNSALRLSINPTFVFVNMLCFLCYLL